MLKHLRVLFIMGSIGFMSTGAVAETQPQPSTDEQQNQASSAVTTTPETATIQQPLLEEDDMD